MSLAFLIVGFAVFAAVAAWAGDAGVKKLGYYGAALCLIVFAILVLLHLVGAADTHRWLDAD